MLGCAAHRRQDLRFRKTRHDFATEVRRHNVDLDVIQQLLGHAAISTTLLRAHRALAQATRRRDPGGDAGRQQRGRILLVEKSPHVDQRERAG